MSATANNKSKLSLLRNKGESVIIGEGDNSVLVTVNYIKEGTVSLCFQADRNTKIDRLERRLERGSA